MNLEEMETALKRFGFDSTDPLRTWLNAALHEVEESFDWPWLEGKLEVIKMAAGSSTITLPANCLKIISIKDVPNQRKLKYYDIHRWMREIQEPTEVGYAEVYTLLNTNEIRIWRVLQEEVEFELIYQATTPDLLESASEPRTGERLWPLSTHYVIVRKAAIIALEAENEEERAEKQNKQYELSLLKLMGKYGERELDEPTTVVDTQGYTEATSTRWW